MRFRYEHLCSTAKQRHDQIFFKGEVHTLNIDNLTEKKNNLVHTYYKLLYKIVYIYIYELRGEGLGSVPLPPGYATKYNTRWTSCKMFTYFCSSETILSINKN